MVWMNQINFSIMPWQTAMTLDPILQILNAPDASQEALTETWKNAKLAELLFSGLSVGSITLQKLNTHEQGILTMH